MRKEITAEDIDEKSMNEKDKEFLTWDSHKIQLVTSEDKNKGIKFTVKGKKLKGTVKIWYNKNTDFFDIELYKEGAEKPYKEIHDINYLNLHDTLDYQIEGDNNEYV